MSVEDPLTIGGPPSAMFDALFWWCAFVALAGSYVLVGIALIGGRSRLRSAEAKLSGEATLVMRHFGQA